MFLYFIWKFSNSSKRAKTIVTLIVLIVPVILMLFSIGAFSYRNYAVSGDSMAPSLNKDALIFVKKTEPQDLKRGDIIIIDSPLNEDVELIRRVFALPGDTVKVSSGSVYLNNQFFKKFDPNSSVEPIRDSEKKVPENTLYVISDNLQAGTDSRSWGVIPFSSVNYIYAACYYKCSENNK